MIELSFRVSTALKSYVCRTLAENGCGRNIAKGETYFCVTKREDERYRSIRYCLECADRLYPGEVQLALSEIKRTRNRKKAGKQVGRVRFLHTKARAFRNTPTASEKFLWEFLCNSKLGVAFYRQKVLHGYVLDFWCPEKQLAVELDGTPHRNKREKDQARDSILKSHGIRILRFPSLAVYSDLNIILETIRLHLR